MNMTFEQKKNIEALSITIGVHLLLILVFIFYKYEMPKQQPVTELGIEVNLGTTEDGFGMEQPEYRDDPAAARARLAAATATNAGATLTQEVYRTDDPDAISVPGPTRSRNARQQAARPSRAAGTQQSGSDGDTRPAQSPRYVYSGASGTGGNSASRNQAGGSEGIGQGEGDMGVPGGTPGAANYTGTPGFGGISYRLNNRTLVNRPDPAARFREGGKVVFNITVNKEGVITRFTVASASNSTIKAIAEQKIRAVKFNKDANARPEEFGTLTFNFRTGQ